MTHLLYSIVILHQRIKHLFYHSAEGLDLYESEAADTTFLLPADQSELTPGN